LFLFLLVSIVLMMLDHRHDHMEKLRGALSVVVYPLQYMANVPFKIGGWAYEALVARRVLLEENARLRQQNMYLKTHSQKFAALERENVRLRQLLDASRESGEHALVADVVAVGREGSSREVVLDKGSQHGVYLGQPIIDANGIVGQVIHVTPISCTGMMITDSSHAIPVQVNRNGLRAIANGTGTSDELQLAYVPFNADVKKGDLLVSSGLDGRFPAGYPVGEIARVQNEPGGSYATIIARPSGQFSNPQELLLVWPARDPIAVGSLSQLSSDNDSIHGSASQN
jgi:rod shape-determining protein MreC